MNTTSPVENQKRDLSLSGQPLDPYIISTRAIKTKNEQRRQKESRGFFNFISKKFSQASTWHFGDNPTRKIRTSHLRVHSDRSGMTTSNYQDPKRSEYSVSNTLNNTIELDPNNLYGFLNTINPNSEIFNSPATPNDPVKLVKYVSSLRDKKDNSFVKYIKKQFDSEQMTYFVKDKPVYKQANKGYDLMYCI